MIRALMVAQCMVAQCMVAQCMVAKLRGHGALMNATIEPLDLKSHDRWNLEASRIPLCGS
ncbi:hypothetical protein ES332_A02G156200v1 [Gossypium tomentosum]|uniref:Secreted protein n=1 Tax=Gossypium tomentosum TaxID=34277 RepID=A0A5D2RJM3_GOSTO|nr:hypothetical protein ES332_A02G156200v1 [Gossypium tomentosum]